ncbi:probable protein S-acyltransferase 23 [Patiria miniata]|uniref:Palmitoyltransferase n=1 Tax=Patiria miniata TaxID=46514 RepID=A0A913ZUA5_PATMI|nr:probable protein S-acyltransferase 23 [Patiria miniata]
MDQEKRTRTQGEDDKESEEKAKMPSMNIFQAVKANYLIRVQELVESEGPGILVEFDDKGHSPVHWAALGGSTNIIRLMVQCKVPLDQQSKTELGPRPIHWACVNGHVAVVDILLQASVSIDTVDNKGCTPLIIACQYGQTVLAGYLMGKGARLQLTDREGDNALHWAAFKGKCDLTRLLIYSGFNPRQKDNFGQTPLHLACINGDLNTVKMLCEQDGVEMELEDNNHKTPLMLATGRNHSPIITYLNKKLNKRRSFLPQIDLNFIVFGPPGNTRVPFIFLVCQFIFFAYPMYVFKLLPLYSLFDLPEIHTPFLALNAFMWFMLYRAYNTDPGYIPKNSPDYDRAIRQVAHFDEWKQGKNPLSRLCHTCRIVKPFRTKHCRTCNKCVRHFDHHCPYIYNCVGFRNRVYFTGFTTSLMLMALFTFYYCYLVIRLEGWRVLYIFGLLDVLFFDFVATGLSLTAWYMAVKNLNTNERVNHKRYEYLKDANGHFFNPYNRGILHNVKEFFHLRAPPSDEEIEQASVYTV